MLFYHVGYKNSEPEWYGTYPMFAHVVLNKKATVKDFMFGRGAMSPEEVRVRLLEACIAEKPDAIFMSIQSLPELFGELDTLIKLKEMGIVVIMIWVDVIYESFRRWLEYYSPYVSFSIIIDDPTYLNVSPHPERILPMFSTCQVTHKYDPNFDFSAGRDIDVSFVGTRDGYYQREEALAYLAQQGVSVFHCGWFGYEWGKDITYDEVWLRSKITLNFTKAKHIDRDQMKGRGFEAALSGAMLLENVNNLTPVFFSPGVDYIEFSSLPDMVDKIRYYLSHEDERVKIVKNAYEKAHHSFVDEAWWAVVIDRIDKEKQYAKGQEEKVEARETSG